ncbi:hypothetical protein TCE0_011r00590 [Talaromyces pinophilus]|uniref:FAD/NAD(P)-binding domain-containing protein n=1 Tax=Talaromyces pinophilus TaxID=128442 RepID=A0A0B8N0I1_TALPI|nr:hypothetical protein TCE0_011r00590 [Talaromyces pinophilus]
MSSLSIAQKATRVLVAGGSYAGLSVTLNLLDLCNGLSPRFSGTNTPVDRSQQSPIEVTIVDERDGFYHLIGTPLAYASKEYAKKSWIRFQDIPALQTPSVKIVHASITQLNCEEKFATVRAIDTKQNIKIPYDYFVAASGLRRTKPSAPVALTRKEYLEDALEHIRLAEGAKEGVVVIGAGAVGIEIAAELKMLHPHLKVTLVHSRQRILSSEDLSDEFKDLALNLVHEAGVETILGARVKETIENSDSNSTTYEVVLSDGRRVQASFVINAISKFHPTATYLPPTAVDEEGYVKIESSTAFIEGTPNATSHYAAGDIARWPGIKRCGAAMHQGLHTAVNIHQRILAAQNGIKPHFKELDSNVPPMMGLAVGKKAASYSPQTGTASGEDVMKMFFGDDLGFTICWNYLRLGEAPCKRLQFLTFNVTVPTLDSKMALIRASEQHGRLLKRLAGDVFPVSHRRSYIAREEEASDTSATETTALNATTLAKRFLGEQSNFDFDAYTELTFASQEALQAYVVKTSQADIAATIAADEEKFLDRLKTGIAFLEDVTEVNNT